MANETKLVVPELGESIAEAVIGKWLKQIGDVVAADEPVVDLETDKITVQLPAPVAGVLSKQSFSEGDTVKVGAIVGEIAAGAAGRFLAAEDAPVPATAPVPASAAARLPLAATVAAPLSPHAAAWSSPVPSPAPGPRPGGPAARRAARTGQATVPALPPTPAAPAARVPLVEPAGAGEDVVPMSPLRKRIAERLVQAQQSSASLTTFNEVDMTNAIALRKMHGDAFLSTHGVKLGYMSFFAKAAVAGLKLYPGVNAEVRGDAIVYKKHYDLGIAVGTERGLVVPVVRNVDHLSFAEIERGIHDLATKAKTSKLVVSDMVGATFTVTNGGIYGSMMSTPLLNFPQTGILGMHNITKRALVIGDKVEVRPVMYIALTYDHRVVDGREAVGFLVAVKERVENPDRLLFDL